MYSYQNEIKELSSKREENKTMTNFPNLLKDRHVLILYTGGTIGMEKGPNGLYPRKNFLYEYSLNHPNLCDKNFTKQMSLSNINKTCDLILKNDTVGLFSNKNFLITPEIVPNRRIYYKIYEFEKVIDSSCMNMDYWKLIGRTIERFYNDYDGFIILHGTDTMNYTACALSFMLENLNKTVVLTGSQIPLIQVRNDALKNYVDALMIAGMCHIPEVTIMFDSKLMRGNRSIKYDNMGLNAFDSPNLCPLVEMNINMKINWNMIHPSPAEEFNYFEDIDNRITVIKYFPIISDSTIESFLSKDIDELKAVIIETSSGIFPLNRDKVNHAIQKASEKGIIIVNVSQGRKEVQVTHEIREKYNLIGIVFAGDMTVECCLAKLSYLLGKNYEPSKIKRLIQESLRGELSSNEGNEKFSIGCVSVVDALLNLVKSEKISEENYNSTKSLLPTVINEIVSSNNIALIKKLQSVIININFEEYTKTNPLHIAARNGNIQMCNLLIRCRINLNKIDENLYTPLNYACENNHRELSMYLKSEGAILNQPKDLGELFFRLIFENQLETIKLFFECGANLTYSDYDKNTISHIAAAEGKKEIIEFFVYDTDLNMMVENRWGETPHAVASDEIKQIIEQKFTINTKCKKNINNFTN